MDRFQHKDFDIFADISFLPIHLCTSQNQFFFHFWMLVFCTEMEEKKFYKSQYRAGNIMQWFCKTIKLGIISVKIYDAIMVKVIFAIKSNI